jgi:hypothetical protein
MRRGQLPASTGISVASALATLLVAACGANTALTPPPVSRPLATAPTATADTAQTPTPAASASEPIESRGGVTVGDLTGTWTGDLVTVSESLDPAKDSTWKTRLTIDECTPGAPCGRFSSATRNAEGTGKGATCDGTLTYRGFYKDRAAFEFQETITASGGAMRCPVQVMILTPLASGATLGVEEKRMSFGAHGLFLRSTSP